MLAAIPGVQPVLTDNAPAPAGPYVQGVCLQQPAALTFVSGQLPLDTRTGQIVHGEAAEQLRVAMAHALGIVAAAGGNDHDVVKVTIFTTRLSEAAAMNEAYAEIFPSWVPARSMVGVTGLPQGALVEVEVTAACGPRTAPSSTAAGGAE